MASPQTENGYTKIANELLDAMCQLHLSGNQWKVLHAIIRKTYGWNKTVDFLTGTQIADMTGMHSTHVYTALRVLRDRRVITWHNRLIAIQKDYEQWKVTETCHSDKNLSQGKKRRIPVTTVTETSHKKVTGIGTHKRKKDTIPKDSSQAKPKKPRPPTENQLWVRDIAQACHLPTKKPPGVGRIAKIAKQYREAGYERRDIVAFAAYWQSDPWKKQNQAMSLNVLQKMSDFGAWVDAGKPPRVNGKGPRGSPTDDGSHAAINRAVERIKEREALA